MGSAVYVARYSWALWSVLAIGSIGCNAFNKTASWGDGPPPQSEPDVEDKWEFVGKEGRGGRAVTKENDPLKPLLMSDQARQIERNLGYD